MSRCQAHGHARKGPLAPRRRRKAMADRRNGPVPVPGTGRARNGLLLAVAADVFCDLFLERLQPSEELFGRDRLPRLTRPDEPGRSLDRDLPRRLVGVAVLLFCLLERLNPVEVDVREPVALLLVELDPGAL